MTMSYRELAYDYSLVASTSIVAMFLYNTRVSFKAVNATNIISMATAGGNDA